MYGGCVYDYLEISFDDYSWKYCGNGSNSFIPDHFISSGSSMTIKFHSDRLGTKPGFFARWEEIQGIHSIKSMLIFGKLIVNMECGIAQLSSTIQFLHAPIGIFGKIGIRYAP